MAEVHLSQPNRFTLLTNILFEEHGELFVFPPLPTPPQGQPEHTFNVNTLILDERLRELLTLLQELQIPRNRLH